MMSDWDRFEVVCRNTFYVSVTGSAVIAAEHPHWPGKYLIAFTDPDDRADPARETPIFVSIAGCELIETVFAYGLAGILIDPGEESGFAISRQTLEAQGEEALWR